MPPVGHGDKASSPNDFRSMFDLQPARHAQVDLIKLAKLMIQPVDINDPKDGADDEENTYTPAGYTYLGQFVDHDLTFDTTSDLADLNSFAFASDQRTPRFDLDNVYGAGPADQPYMYEADATGALTGKLLLGDKLGNGVQDVRRSPEGRAIIGDPRNDENSLVAQLQSVFIRFHNALVDKVVAGNGVPKQTGNDAFTWAQTETRHHYQRLLLDDFLPRIIDTNVGTVKALFNDLAKGIQPKLKYFSPNDGESFMPLEFACAAYRLGHSMIRPGYRMNPATILSIFAGQNGGLRGFKPLDKSFGIDWSLFFHETLPAGTPLDQAGRDANNAKNGKPIDTGTEPPFKRTQFGYKIDTMLVDPIAHLPTGIAPGLLPDDPDPTILRNLAVRNLLRGRDFGLPSGEDVARLVGASVLTPDRLLVRGADFDPAHRIAISEQIPAFKGNTPLWFYILGEAEQGVIKAMHDDPKTDPQSLGARLGSVGALIVAETFIGLMQIDRDSVLNTQSRWHSCINGTPTFTMIELLKFIKAIP
jgi:hypothetical protein